MPYLTGMASRSGARAPGSRAGRPSRSRARSADGGRWPCRAPRNNRRPASPARRSRAGPRRRPVRRPAACGSPIPWPRPGRRAARRPVHDLAPALDAAQLGRHLDPGQGLISSRVNDSAPSPAGPSTWILQAAGSRLRVEPDRAVDAGHPRRGAGEFRRAAATRRRAARANRSSNSQHATQRPG